MSVSGSGKLWFCNLVGRWWIIKKIMTVYSVCSIIKHLSTRYLLQHCLTVVSWSWQWGTKWQYEHGVDTRYMMMWCLWLLHHSAQASNLTFPAKTMPWEELLSPSWALLQKHLYYIDCGINVECKMGEVEFYNNHLVGTLSMFWREKEKCCS